MPCKMPMLQCESPSLNNIIHLLRHHQTPHMLGVPPRIDPPFPLPVIPHMDGHETGINADRSQVNTLAHGETKPDQDHEQIAKEGRMRHCQYDVGVCTLLKAFSQPVYRSFGQSRVSAVAISTHCSMVSESGGTRSPRRRQRPSKLPNPRSFSLGSE